MWHISLLYFSRVLDFRTSISSRQSNHTKKFTSCLRQFFMLTQHCRLHTVRVTCVSLPVQTHPTICYPNLGPTVESIISETIQTNSHRWSIDFYSVEGLERLIASPTKVLFCEDLKILKIFWVMMFHFSAEFTIMVNERVPRWILLQYQMLKINFLTLSLLFKRWTLHADSTSY